MVLAIAQNLFSASNLATKLSNVLHMNVSVLDQVAARRRRLVTNTTIATVAAINVTASQLQTAIVQQQPVLQNQLGYNITSLAAADTGASSS